VVARARFANNDDLPSRGSQIRISLHPPSRDLRRDSGIIPTAIVPGMILSKHARSHTTSIPTIDSGYLGRDVLSSEAALE